MTATPLLDQVTVARFTLADFPTDLRDEEALAIPAERHALEACLRELVDFEAVAQQALELWRERREEA